MMFALAGAGCSDDGVDSGGGGTGGGGPPLDPWDPDGDQCFPDIQKGWDTQCTVVSAGIVVLEGGGAVQLPGMVDDFPICCEGSAGEECPGHCQSLCQELVCWHAMEEIHMQRAYDDPDIVCAPNVAACGFSFDDCEQGVLHTQTYASGQSYQLIASCDAICSEPVGQNGVFDWVPGPLSGRPEKCFKPGGLQFDPGAGIQRFVAKEDAGTEARVDWSTGQSSGSEDSASVDVEFAYNSSPCPTDPTFDCLYLSKLELDTPPVSVGGIAITDARLRVVDAATTPQLSRSGTFRYATGELTALLTGTTANGTLISRTLKNAGIVSGVISPATDSLSVSGLSFDFVDSNLAATLWVSISGSYVRRPPVPSFVARLSPKDCGEPVEFEATSTDPEGGTLSHAWWVPGIGAGSGNPWSVVLPAGRYNINVLSVDQTNRFSMIGQPYERVCD
jgi:hypothetical protein